MVRTALMLAGLVVAAGCGGRAVELDAEQWTSIAETPESAWRRLAEQKVFFGHQSVGDNIIDGVHDLLAARPDLGLVVAELPEPQRLTRPGLYHARIGRNHEPRTKTDHFARLIEEGLAPDIALHKYCFVDLDESTDVTALFEHYRSAMERLAAAHPEITFVHVTVPLTQVRMGPRDWLNKLVGRRPSEYVGDMVRAQFNDLLRRRYGGQALFDLAALESTRPGGGRETFSFRGRTYDALAPVYASDGAHLNETGRRLAAAQFLTLLAELAERR